jgi:hypothetical protein
MGLLEMIGGSPDVGKSAALGLPVLEAAFTSVFLTFRSTALSLRCARLACGA